jgi:hypothetical protein
MALQGTNGRPDSVAVGRTTADPPWWSCSLSTEQYRVLAAVAQGRVRRGVLFGRLEPHLLDGREIVGPLRSLAIRGLVVMQPLGPPRCTRRGANLLRSSDTRSHASPRWYP